MLKSEPPRLLGDGAFERCLSNEDSDLMNETSALISDSTVLISPLYHVRLQQADS